MSSEQTTTQTETEQPTSGSNDFSVIKVSVICLCILYAYILRNIVFFRGEETFLYPMYVFGFLPYYLVKLCLTFMRYTKPEP